MTSCMRTRSYLIAGHVAWSILLVSSISFLVFFSWYPGDLLKLQGGERILLFVIAATLCLGPLLSAVVLHSRSKGRKELLLDLALILLLQALTFGYGTWVLSHQRVDYLVFVHDRFFTVAKRDVVGDPPNEVSTSSRWLNGPRPVFVKLSLGAQLEIARSVEGLIQAPPMALLAGAYAPLNDGIWRFEQIRYQAEKTVPQGELIRVPIVGRAGRASALVDIKSGTLLSIE